MEIERMIAALAPIEVVRRAPVEVRDLAYDARAVTPGTLFFCVPGATADGHDFASDALARGAVGLVVERPLDALQQTVAKSVPQLVVADARAAMAVAADIFFGHPSHELTVAAVTGTNGKTTTAFLLFAIFESAGLEPGLLGNIERRVGAERRPSGLNTPEAIDLQRLLREMLDAGNRSCAMEASSHASVQHRLDRVRLAALVFTNLTQDHLDFHGTMERYFDAKRRLFDGVPAAVNIGDPWGRRLAGELGDALTFGLAPDAEVGPDALHGIRFRLRGRFNVENALGAVAAARLLGIGEDAIRAGLEAVEGVPGRFEAVDEGQPFTVLVDYAHTPDSLANILRAARELVGHGGSEPQSGGRVVCVFGCGGDRDRGKRPEMGRIASELADLAVVTSDNPRSEDPQAIVDEIVAGAGTDVEVELDRREAIRRAIAGASAGDVVVIAGKGHEQGQEIAGRKLPFDDREVAREALRELAPTR